MNPLTKREVDIESIECDLLLEASFRAWGYDFRSYARASIERRVRLFRKQAGCQSISELIPKILHDPSFFSEMVSTISVPVTELFRDPSFYRSISENVVPLLKTWPRFKIWHAGCASGEEVYSLAILLMEEGVYDRATIYATDFNDDALDRAREGVYEAAKIKLATRNYQKAGGKKSFSEYYHSRYDAAKMDRALKERIVFSNHNLATDSVFGEMHLILCRNVLIYFDKNLQNRSLNLFTESLVPGGFLCLGQKENLQFTDAQDNYKILDKHAKIYKKGGVL